MKFLAGAFLCILALTSCSQDNHVGKLPHETQYVISVSQALDTHNLGRTVQVKGKVVSVCQDEGCWMVITDGTDKMHVKFQDASVTIPMNLTGDVLVEGTVDERILTCNDAHEVAHSIGYSDSDVAAMKGDQRMPIMVASGVLFYNRN